MDALTRQAVLAGQGSRAALDAFVASGYPPVHRYCTGMLGEHEGADAAQETMIRAARAVARFRGEATALTWLLGIARNVCIDAHTAERRRREVAPGPPARVAGPEGEATLWALVAHLEPARREALLMTRWAGLSYAEAAGVAGVPVGTIRSRVARARADLLALLDDVGPSSASM